MQDVRKEGVLEMKITCTEEEKEQLIITMSCGTQCPFAQTDSVVCDGVMQCKPCIEACVEWDIQTDDKDGEQG